ncbi:MAG: Uma2 family endonuclease [Deltaproteobacteria bacterium]|nr:Uma2 family endonuclease [Deltaproteobacteria bacterium]MBI3079402.1 Uma2 family endonuclease [Deltaproteobacteria bacterium]
MAVQLPRRRLTVEDFHRMAQAGILTEDDRVELLDGELIEMTPIGSRHAGCVNRLNRAFAQRVGDRALVSVQNPIRIAEHSEPQPDMALLRPRADFYAQGHPEPQDVLLVVEVAETSLEVDREVKVPLYGKAGIPEVWLVDLAEGCVEVYRTPTPHGYAERQRMRPGQQLSTQEIPSLVLTVDEILG